MTSSDLDNRLVKFTDQVPSSNAASFRMLRKERQDTVDVDSQSTSSSWRAGVSPRIANFQSNHHHALQLPKPPSRLTQPRTMNLSIFRPVFRPYKPISLSQPTNIWQRTAQRTCPQQQPNTQRAAFSTTPSMQKRSKKGPGNDPRISASLPPFTLTYHET
jgi:hypothetical protein